MPTPSTWPATGTSVTEHTGRTATWQYDALYRLLNETVQEPGQPTTSESFTYDPVGNRTTQTNAQGSFAHTYDLNDWLLSDGRATYTWDPNGNLQSRTDALGTTAYTWDARDRLIQAAGPTVGTVEHAYDARGQRVADLDGRGPGQLPGRRQPRPLAGDRRARRVREPHRCVRARGERGSHSPATTAPPRLRPTSTTTGRGSVRVLTDAAASVTDAYAYSAFGELVSASGGNANPYRYGGQWEEPRTGLYHLRARLDGSGAGAVSLDRPVRRVPAASGVDASVSVREREPRDAR